MTLLALGINHKTAPVALRERVAFGPDVLEQALDLFEPGFELKRDQPPPQARPEIAA